MVGTYSFFFDFLTGFDSLLGLLSELLLSPLLSELDFDASDEDLFSASAFFLYDSLR